jgi:hypothetical protein
LRSHHLAAVLLPLALSACSADPATPPPFTPGTSASSPSASPTAHAETAEEFIRRWIEVADAVQLDGDTGPYRAMTRGCDSCDAFANTVDRIYKAGGYIDFGGTQVLSISRRAGHSYDYFVDAGATSYRETAHGPLKRLPGGHSKLGVDLTRSSRGWLVTDSYRRPETTP